MQNVKQLLEKIRKDAMNPIFTDLYGGAVTRQKERYIRALETFQSLYGERDVEIYSAPGRSEVGGNHTDHQHGHVLAASVNLDAIAIVAKNQDGDVHIKSEGFEAFCLNCQDLEYRESEQGTSLALVRGVMAKLQSNGHAVGGFDAYITSSVLGGSGLSSSAAFEVLIGHIVSGLFNHMRISAVEIAIVSQFAENVYFGKPCGLMDQMTSSVGNMIHIDFKDPENPLIHKVNTSFDDFGYRLCIVDTKGSHADLTDDYASIPSEMKRIANYFNQAVLRDVTREDVLGAMNELRSRYGDRAILRALHFFEEEERVKQQVQALESHDFERFKALIRQSGDSSFKYLQNVYSPKYLQAQNIALGLALTDLLLGEEVPARVHGGGFAGTMQVFVEKNKVAIYKKQIESVFGPDSCYVLQVRKYGGIKVV